MTRNRICLTAHLCIAALAILAGCSGTSGLGSVNLWPFGEVKEQERVRVAPNTVAYQCQGGKKFYVRDLENGAAAMVTLADRELRLERDKASPKVRYARARTTLEIEGEGAALADGAEIFAGCTRAAGS